MPLLRPLLPVLASILVAILPPLLAAQTATISSPGGPGLQGFPASAPGWVLNFRTMNSGENLGQVALQVYGVKRFWEPEIRRGWNARTDLISRLVDPPSGLAYNTPIAIDSAEALALGVSQEQLNRFFSRTDVDEDPYLSARLYKAFIGAAPGQETRFAHERQGTSTLFWDAPQIGPWKLVVTDSHGNTRSSVLNVPAPGVYGVQIGNVFAGNCRVTIQTYANGNYLRQEPVVVRKDQTTGVGVRFVTGELDARRFVIKHLSLGQGSQNEQGALPMVAGKKAMLRVMLQDSKGQHTPGQVLPKVFRQLQVEYNGIPLPTGTFEVDAQPVNSGVEFITKKPFTIPAAAVRPGLLIKATLINPSTGAVVDVKELRPEVRQARTIYIHPFSVKARPGGSGAPVGRNENNGFYIQLARWAEERFPCDRIVVLGGHRIDNFDPFAPLTSDALLFSTMALMNAIARSHGYSRGDENHLFVGMINSRYKNISGATGMALYGNPGVALFMQDPHEMSGYNLAHEMAHSYGLYHAPSPGASSWLLGVHVNRIDESFPYSGNGFSAGYAYSAIYDHFNRELTQHRDPLSYSSAQAVGSTYFSDHFYTNLVSQLTWGGAAPYVSPAPLLTIPKNASGQYVFGETEARPTEVWANSRFKAEGLCSNGNNLVFGEKGQVLEQQDSFGLRLLSPSVKKVGPASLTKAWQPIMIDPGDGGGGRSPA